MGRKKARAGDFATLDGLAKLRWDDLLARAALTPIQWQTHRLLRRLLPYEDWHVFAAARMSAFIDPEPFFDRRGPLLDAILEGSVLFAIGSAPPSSRLLLAVIDEHRPDALLALREFGVRTVSFDPSASAERMAEAIADAAKETSRAEVVGRRPINVTENNAAREVLRLTKLELERRWPDFPAEVREGMTDEQWDEELAALTPVILHEVALDRLRPTLLSGLTTREDWIVRSSSVDLLVHGRGEINRPLLAIELDGPTHSAPDQARKDQIKDAVFRKFGIPLIRVGWTEADFSQRNSARGARARDLDRFAALLSNIAQSIAGMRREQIQDALAQEVAATAAARAVDATSSAMFGASYKKLGREQRHAIDATTASMEPVEADFFARASADFFRSQRMDDALADQAWPDDLASLGTPPTFAKSANGRLSASATLALAGSAVVVATPAIRIQMANGIDMELANATLKGCLVLDLVEEARARVRMATPAKRRG